MFEKICLCAGIAMATSSAWALESNEAENLNDEGSADSMSVLTGSKTSGSAKKSKTSSTSKTVQSTKKAASKAKKKNNVVEKKLEKGTVGLKLSLNMPWMTTDHDDTEFSTTANFQGGISYDSALFGPLGYRIEAMYSRKGATYEGNEKGLFGSEELDIISQYFEIPAMLTLRFQVIPMLTLYAGFGVYLGYDIETVSMKDGKKRKSYVNAKGKEKKFKDAWTWFDYGINLTFGAFVPINSSLMASAEFRYVHGTKDIEDHDETGTPDDDPIQNSNCLLTLGLHF